MILFFDSYFQGVKSDKNVNFGNFFPYVSAFLNIVEKRLLKLKVPDAESLCFKFYDIWSALPYKNSH